MGKYIGKYGKSHVGLLKMQGYPLVREILSMEPQQKHWVGKGRPMMLNLKRSCLNSMCDISESGGSRYWILSPLFLPGLHDDHPLISLV